MKLKSLFYCGLLIVLWVGCPIRATHGQPEQTWLSVEGGYLHQKQTPIDLRAPVSLTKRGFSSAIALYYDLQQSYHRGEVIYQRQHLARLHPSGLSLSNDPFTSLSITYEYTRYHFRDITDLHLDFGSGPYVFAIDQYDYLQSDDGPTITNNSQLYGGGINITIRYHRPKIPLTARLHLINGGFLGNREVSTQNNSTERSSTKGWFSKINLRVGYRIQADWRLFISCDWLERLEYRSDISRRRTFQNVNFGISYRLEDD